MDDFTYLIGSDAEANDSVLTGRGASVVKVPADHWRSHVTAATERISARLAFMSEEHHLIRRFAVTELARRVMPVTEAHLSGQLKLPQDRVRQILGELESRLFFLVRDSNGAVSWAYPFTSDQTPHTIIRKSRGAAHAAWAEDAIAAPFVEGRLLNDHFEARIESRCAHCDRVINFTMDSELRTPVAGDSAWLLFEPDVNWEKLKEPNIINAYWRNSVFFWSEEHAREQREKRGGVDGIYLSPHQSLYSTRIAQAALFGFRL